MNILYLCEEYPPGKNGGIGSMVKLLAGEMVKQGHRVYVVGLYPQGYGQADYEEDSGVKVWRLRYKTDIGLLKNNFSLTDTVLRRLLRYSSLLHWDTKNATRRLFSFIANLVKQHQVDIIEMPDWNTFLHNSFTPIHIPDFGVPLVVKFHGSHSYLRSEMNQPVSKLIFKAEQALLNRADALTAVSRYTADKTAALFGLGKQVGGLYNSIHIPPAANTAVQDNTIIFAGALSKSKGVHALLQAWNSVHRQCPDAVLHLYGKGPLHQLKKIPGSAALSSIVFHGHVNREVLLTAFAEATVAVFPSYSECFSIAPLEAMAAGCAVVFTERSSGAELVIHGQNGLLINPDDTTAIADAILLLLSDRSIRNKLAMAGHQTVTAHFNITLSAQQHIQFYAETIGRYQQKLAH
jgi:glycosyltransferase involved in cell wall biosynthesis